MLGLGLQIYSLYKFLSYEGLIVYKSVLPIDVLNVRIFSFNISVRQLKCSCFKFVLVRVLV